MTVDAIQNATDVLQSHRIDTCPRDVREAIHTLLTAYEGRDPASYKAQERDATNMSIAFQDGIRWWKHQQSGALVTRKELKQIHNETARRYRSHLAALSATENTSR